MRSDLPVIIQGGMGIGVSGWRLARAVSLRGQLGVVSGTCIDTVFIRRLQDGDVDGQMRRAIAAFPFADVGADAMRRYFHPDGRNGVPYKLLPLWKQHVSKARIDLAILAGFAEVYLAKEGHDGLVGINLLTKVQLPNLATLYGAMLAGVDYVLMGAGIPKEIPGVLDAFAEGREARMRFDVEGLERGVVEELVLNPADCLDRSVRQLKRPMFLPVVAAHSLATMLARKSNGEVNGFIVEAPIAGGHNAPPRGQLEMNAQSEPVYGERDVVDFAEMRKLGKPFWLAGGTASPQRLANALAAGAAGVQVGTAFAFANESGVAEELKRAVIAKACANDVVVTTDMRASPTGFPFKVIKLAGTNSCPVAYASRDRTCDLGYLRNAYKRPDGRIGFRCAGEPVEAWAEKGGADGETDGRKCLCNGLLANIGLAQERADGVERALLTSGNDVSSVALLAAATGSYSAGDVVDYLLS
jgi:nitronate monooxygenase